MEEEEEEEEEGRDSKSFSDAGLNNAKC